MGAIYESYKLETEEKHPSDAFHSFSVNSIEDGFDKYGRDIEDYEH